MERKIGSWPCRRTHRSLVAGSRCRCLSGCRAEGSGRRSAVGSLPSLPTGSIRDEAARTGGAAYPGVQNALSRCANRESVHAVNTGIGPRSFASAGPCGAPEKRARAGPCLRRTVRTQRTGHAKAQRALTAVFGGGSALSLYQTPSTAVPLHWPVREGPAQ